MNDKTTVRIGSVNNGFVLGHNRERIPFDADDLYVFPDLDQLISYLMKHFDDTKNPGPE